MKTGKIPAKLRDAVPVCLMVEGEEVKPFDIKALIASFTTVEAAPETEPVTEEAAGQTTEAEAKVPDSMEIHYNVTGLNAPI